MFSHNKTPREEASMWLLAAAGSAIFAGLTSILAKCGVKTCDSDVATALRTSVVLVFAWIMAAISGQINGLLVISGHSMIFLALSGLATGASWICYFKALSLGEVNRVVPLDKTSSVLAMLLAMALFHETNALTLKLACCAVILVGTLLMTNISFAGIKGASTKTSGDAHAGSNKKASTQAHGAAEVSGDAQAGSSTWLWYAVASAIFAALTSILAKVGIEDVSSNLATAVRTCYVFVIAWAIVFARKKQGLVRHIPADELRFLGLSGIATGASWLCYYYAIQNGVVSIVVPIDKLSILITTIFAMVFLHEKLSRKNAVGLALITGATLVMAIYA